ncbi:MAG: histidine kinase N-terminal 7TM domain-containing protein [Eubacteriales bacterium]|nr:histidine kinase N-terminal 7TM domain-containing protein [Eubacteriales bacterium]
MGILRSLLYIALYLSWGWSIQKRVIQRKTRKIILRIVGLMIFWFVIRSVKYFFVVNSMALRQLWYWYYLPMLFIPMLALMVALSVGKPEGYKESKLSKALYVPTILLVLLVVTNDFHHLVFSFPEGEIPSDKNNILEPGYYLTVIWGIGLAIAAMGIIVTKSRLQMYRKYLPAGVLFVSVIYIIVYASGAEWMQMIGGDITAALCLMIVTILESCIRCGLISTNTRYDSLFQAGSLKAQIVDSEGVIRYANGNAPVLSLENIRKSYDRPVNIDSNTRLKSSVIPGGHVLWVEDIAEIQQILEELEENRRSLSEQNNLNLENYNVRKKINIIREKNRLYNQLQVTTRKQIEKLDYLLDSYSEEEDPEGRRRILAEIMLIGAYVKRRGNLVFLEEKNELMDISELTLCLRESFYGLRLFGIECAMNFPNQVFLDTSDVIRIYDFFESIVETAWGNLTSVWLVGRTDGNGIRFCFEIESEGDFSRIADIATTASEDNGVWRFTIETERREK